MTLSSTIKKAIESKLHIFQKFSTVTNIGVICSTILLVVCITDALKLNELGSKKSLDFLSQAFPYDRHHPENSPGLVLVAIDDESLQKLGQWPWPRKTIARIIENIGKSEAASIGVDVLFIEQDRYSPEKLSVDLSIPIKKLTELGFSDGDDQLGVALSQTRSILAFALGQSNAIADINANLASSNRFITTSDSSRYLLDVPGIVMPQKSITKAPGLGFVSTYEDGGIIRETPMVALYKDTFLPSLSLEMLRVAQGASNYVIKPSESGHLLNIKVGNYVVKVNSQGNLLYHHGFSSRFEQISAYRLFQGPLKDLEGRFVVFGVNALALGDQHATVNEDSLPGALIHLQALDQMLSGRFITTHYGLDRIIYLVCAIIGCLVCFLIVKVPLVYSMAILGSSVLALISISIYFFLNAGFVFNFFGSVSILLLGGFVTYFLQSLFEERLRKKMQTSFAQYVPPDVVKRISKSNQLPKLGGELIEASILFLDLRGFTSLTEALKPYPELMVKVIGSIMDEVTARLIESDATIDKYIGDAVMAFWNAPEKQDDHLTRSIYSACRIQEDLELIRTSIQEIDPIVNDAKIAFGIGICCGPITVGNFGSSFRFNYTVLGDAVNTASRLESLTKEKGQPILISANHLMHGQCIEFDGRKMLVEFVGTTEVRGKVEVLDLFTARFI
jgi:adenylate cyclase